jgi:lipopolysaccharide/colanic/teichoic acid biosynthesis glycosyltransferase
MDTTPTGLARAATADEMLSDALAERAIEIEDALRRPVSAKRAFDFVVAALVLLLTLPLLALIAVAVVVESPGPVFYRANRVGWRGRPLRMLKFRKMAARARGSDEAPLTLAADERLTRVGALLSRTRLDELPQLWHVLRGEMSLVGPRPEDPSFIAKRPQDFAEILTVRPGLTGLSQIAFANERSILRPADPVADYIERILPQKCTLDRLYVARATLVRDVRIIVWTVVAAVLHRPVSVHRETASMRLRRRPSRPVAAVTVSSAR